MHHDKLLYKVVIWVFFGISLWKENEALTRLLDTRYTEWTPAGVNIWWVFTRRFREGASELPPPPTPR